MRDKGSVMSVLLVSVLLAASLTALIPGAEDEETYPNTDVLGSGGTDFTGYTPITNVQELSNIRNNLSGKYYLANDIVFESGTSSNFTPIGSRYDSCFTGIFDGNGYVIDGMRTEVNASSDACSGLFGYVSGGIIKNLGMVNGSSVATSSSSFAYAGGIAGRVLLSSVIVNCYNTGYVSASSSSPTVCVGGIAGYAVSSFIVGCYNTGSISVTTSSNGYVGGIVGGVSSSSYVANCYNTGSVSATAYAGGIAGSSSAPIVNCYNTGSVSLSSLGHAGGIVGVSYFSVTNCYNTGSVSSSSSHGTVGGIVGKMSLGDSISNCYYLRGQLYLHGSYDPAPDVLCSSGNPIVDGNYTHNRNANQRSGDKTIAEMTSSLSAALANDSIYFTGMTGPTEGWDFNTIWTIDGSSDPDNGGLPVLTMVGVPFTVSGKITSDGIGTAGMRVVYTTDGGSPQTTVTDANGNYSITAHLGNIITITKFELTGYDIRGPEPSSYTVSSTADFTWTADALPGGGDPGIVPIVIIGGAILGGLVGAVCFFVFRKH